MGKERENIMPNEKSIDGVELNVSGSPILEAVNEDLNFDFDPVSISQKIARACEPGEMIYKRDASLKKDPFKAIGEVEIHGINVNDVTDPVEGLMIGAAKLETAQKELNLTPKQNKAFDGVLENIHGAIAWAKGAAEGAKDSIVANKIVRKTLIGAQVVGLTLTSAGCVKAISTPTESSPLPTPVVEYGTYTPTSPGSATESATSTTSPETPDPNFLEGAPYPRSADNFIKTPSIKGTEAEKIITDVLKADGDMKAVEQWYKNNKILGSGVSNFAVPVVYIGEKGQPYWNVMVKNNMGHFLKFTLTSGPESGQVYRAMGMVPDLLNKPSFTTSELTDPDGYNGVSQEIVWDKSGWSVVGAFQGDSLVAWYNADAPGGGEWMKLQEPIVTPTPEGYGITEVAFDKSKPGLIDASDGKQYQGYIQDDYFGLRLVDDTNNIILVKDGDTWRPAESRVDTDKYPAAFTETKVVEIEGMQIPVTLNMGVDVQNTIGGANFYFTQVHMTEQSSEATADFYMHLAWARYREIMDHPDLGYDKYIDLVKNGKGNLVIFDVIKRQFKEVDPRQGFSYVMVNETGNDMPNSLNAYEGFYFTTNEFGKLILITNAPNFYYMTINNSNIRDNNCFVVHKSIYTLTLLGTLNNQIAQTRGSLVSYLPLELPDFIVDYMQSSNFISEYKSYNNHLNNTAPFWLK